MWMCHHSREDFTNNSFAFLFIYTDLVQLSNVMLLISVNVLQSHNQILIAAAGGDVTALRQFAREMDHVPLTAVQNEVCPI